MILILRRLFLDVVELAKELSSCSIIDVDSEIDSHIGIDGIIDSIIDSIIDADADVNGTY